MTKFGEDERDHPSPKWPRETAAAPCPLHPMFTQPCQRCIGFTTPVLPTANELKVMADQLNKAIADYIMTPSPENMEAAKMARVYLFAGIDLICAAKGAR